MLKIMDCKFISFSIVVLNLFLIFAVTSASSEESIQEYDNGYDDGLEDEITKEPNDYKTISKNPKQQMEYKVTSESSESGSIELLQGSNTEQYFKAADRTRSAESLKRPNDKSHQIVHFEKLDNNTVVAKVTEDTDNEELEELSKNAPLKAPELRKSVQNEVTSASSEDTVQEYPGSSIKPPYGKHYIDDAETEEVITLVTDSENGVLQLKQFDKNTKGENVALKAQELSKSVENEVVSASTEDTIQEYSKSMKPQHVKQNLDYGDIEIIDSDSDSNSEKDVQQLKHIVNNTKGDNVALEVEELSKSMEDKNSKGKQKPILSDKSNEELNNSRSASSESEESKRISKQEEKRFLEELSRGNKAESHGTNPHYYQPDTYSELNRRYASQYHNKKDEVISLIKEDPGPQNLEPKLASPDLVLAVAKESAMLEASKQKNPSEYFIQQNILRDGNYWNAVWKEDVNPAALRSSSRKPLGVITAKINPGSNLYDLVTKLKQFSPKLLYVVNKKIKY